MYRNLQNLSTNLNYYFLLLLVQCSRIFTKIATIIEKERVPLKKSGRKNVFKECEETELKKCIDVTCNNGFSPTFFEIRVSLTIYCTISTKRLYIAKENRSCQVCFFYYYYYYYYHYYCYYYY